ncbi:MAG: SRPBCC domain-containing protein [Pseudomonadota bacterium]
MDYGNAFGIEFRETTELVFEGKPARAVSGIRTYSTDVEDLWDALTNPDRIPRWFLPITGDLNEGGNYQLQGHAGGKITKCEPPKFFHATWEYGDDISWLQVLVSKVEKGSELSLTHIMLKDDKGNEHWEKYGPAATGVGWDLAFLALDYVLSNANAIIDAAENAAWLTTVAGKLFVRDAAKKWGEAHTFAGEAKDIALEMAKRTASFYTGE